MVSAKPNETSIAGTVRAMRPVEYPAEAVELVVEVDRADDVEGRANLLADAAGEELAVTTDLDDVAELDLQPGERVVLDAEVRGPGAVWSRPRTVRREE